MNKESILSLLRLTLVAVGSYLLGQHLFGQEITHSVWQDIIGATLALVGSVWGILDKTATIEKLQSGLRSAVVVIGGLLVAAGVIKEELLNALLGAIPIIVAAVQSETAKRKSEAIQSGKLDTNKLKTK
jgi:hypothetical protein